MKLLLAAGIFPPDIGGPATYSKILAQALTKRGHTVTVVTYSDVRDAGTGEFRVRRVLRSRFKPRHYLRYFLAVVWYGRNADLIYAQDPVSSGYPAMWAAKILKKPLVVKITGDYSWEQAMGRGRTDKLIDDFQHLPSYPDQIKKIRQVQFAVCRTAVKIVTPSMYLKNLVANWGVGHDRIEVIGNAIEVSDVSLDKITARRDLGVAFDTFLVLSAGRPVKWKGFELLQEIGSELSKQDAKVKLEIITSAPHERLLRYLKAADVFVLNTGYEGFPHIIWEAMTLGTPVVTTNVCGNPEIIQDGRNGLLVGYNNKEQIKKAISKLRADHQLRQKLTVNAQESVKKSTVEGMVNKTEEFLKTCVF